MILMRYIPQSQNQFPRFKKHKNIFKLCAYTQYPKPVLLIYTAAGWIIYIYIYIFWSCHFIEDNKIPKLELGSPVGSVSDPDISGISEKDKTKKKKVKQDSSLSEGKYLLSTRFCFTLFSFLGRTPNCHSTSKRKNV